MSNNKNNKEQNKVIELTREQQNPYLARPEHFEVEKPNAPAGMTVPGTGQRGENEREETELLAERKAQGRGVALPAEVDDASAPHSK